jgi:hypothetical protein
MDKTIQEATLSMTTLTQTQLQSRHADVGFVAVAALDSSLGDTVFTCVLFLLGERWRSRSRRQKTMIQIRGQPATCVHRFVRPWFVLSLFPVSLVRTTQKHMIGENQRNQMRWSKDSIPQSRWGLHHVRAILKENKDMHGIGSSFCRDASKENRGPLVRQDAGKAGRIALARSAHAMKAFRGLSKRNACPCFSLLKIGSPQALLRIG